MENDIFFHVVKLVVRKKNTGANGEQPFAPASLLAGGSWQQ
jgi:hypothetical protein